VDFIKNPQHPRFYPGDKNDRMPPYGEQKILDDHAIGLIADWIRGDLDGPSGDAGAEAGVQVPATSPATTAPVPTAPRATTAPATPTPASTAPATQPDLAPAPAPTQPQSEAVPAAPKPAETNPAEKPPEKSPIETEFELPAATSK
jgi:hypothetical protein